MSNEKNIQPTACNCDKRTTDNTDLASIDDDELDEQRDNTETKQPKTIKNIMVALKEGKNRENSSPMRGNRPKLEASPKVPKLGSVALGLKSNAESSPNTSSKAGADSAKRGQGMQSLKHQVRLFYIKLYILI